MFTCEQERTRLWSNFSKDILPLCYPSCYSVLAFRKYRKIELQIIWSPCQLQTHYNNSTGMTTSSMTIRIWRIFECEGLMVGWCVKRLKGPGLHLINYRTPLQLTWLRKLSKSLNIQYNRWTDKIESILRRIWLFEPHSHLSPLIKWIPFSNLVTERFLCVATIKEITWGGVWKAKIGGGLTTTYLTSTRSLRKYHYNMGKKHLTSNT